MKLHIEVHRASGMTLMSCYIYIYIYIYICCLHGVGFDLPCPMSGGCSGYIDPGPESYGGARELRRGPRVSEGPITVGSLECLLLRST